MRRTAYCILLQLFVLFLHQAESTELPPLCLYDDAELVTVDGKHYISIGPHAAPWDVSNAGTCYFDNWPFYNMHIAEKMHHPSRWVFKNYWACGEWIPSFNSSDSTIDAYAHNLLFMFHMVYVRFIPESAPFSERQMFQFWTYSDETGKDGDNVFSVVNLKNVVFNKGDKIRWFALHLFDAVGDLSAGQHFWVQVNDKVAHYGYNPNTSLFTSNIYRFYIGCGSHGTVYYPQLEFNREPASGKLRLAIGTTTVTSRDVTHWLVSSSYPQSPLLKFPDQQHDVADYPVLLPENIWSISEGKGEMGKSLQYSGGNVELQRPKRFTRLLPQNCASPVEIRTEISALRYKTLLNKKSVLQIHFMDIAECKEQRLEMIIDVLYQTPSNQVDSVSISFSPFNKKFAQRAKNFIFIQLPNIWNQWTLMSLDLQQILDHSAEYGWIPEHSSYLRPSSIHLKGKLIFTDLIFSPNNITWPSEASTPLFWNLDYEPVEQIKIWPNPTNRVAQFSFYVLDSDEYRPVIYSLCGRQVKKFAVQSFHAGINRLDWDLKDANGFDIASGIYFIVLNSKRGDQLREKFTVIK